MTTPTHSDHNDEMDPKDGSEEPPGRWPRSPSEMEMDLEVDVDSEDEVDRHLQINNDDDHDDSHQRIRSSNNYETIDSPNRSDVEASTTPKIPAGTSESHARTTDAQVQVQVEGRKKSWFSRLPFRQHISPPVPVLALPLSGAEPALDPHRLPLPTTRSRSKSRSRSRPHSRAATPLPPLPFHQEEDERPGPDEEEDGESDGVGEKMCRICFTGEDTDSDDDDEGENSGDSNSDAEKNRTPDKRLRTEKKPPKQKEAGGGLGRLISPCLCRGSMRVSLIRLQVFPYSHFPEKPWGSEIAVDIRLGVRDRPEEALHTHRWLWMKSLSRGDKYQDPGLGVGMRPLSISWCENVGCVSC